MRQRKSLVGVSIAREDPLELMLPCDLGPISQKSRKLQLSQSQSQIFQ